MKRPGFGTAAVRTVQMQVNSFAVKRFTEGPIFQYDGKAFSFNLLTSLLTSVYVVGM